MTDAAIVAVCTAVPLLVAQIVNLIISGRNNRKIEEVATKVDGTASASQQREESLQKEVTLLRGILADNKEAANLLASRHSDTKTSAPQEVIITNKDDNAVPVKPT